MANVSLIATFADQSASQLAGAVSQLVPPGAIMSYGGSNAPTGWLLCDGAAVSRTLYANLFAAIGTTFGLGDGINTFNLPDMRGRFVRYDDNMGNHGITGVTPTGAASRDTGRSHGSAQTQTTAPNGLGGTAAGQTQGATTTNLNSGSAAGQALGSTPVSLGSGAASGTTSIAHTHAGGTTVRGSVGGSDGTHVHRIPSNQNAGGSVVCGWASGNGGAGASSIDALTNFSGHGHGFSLTADGQTLGDTATPLNSGAASGSTDITHTHSASAVTGTTNITHTHGSSALTVTGDTETRPINIALNAIIKI